MSKNFIPIAKFFPSFITFLSLCIGLTSIRFALDQKWELAVTAIIFSAILDCLDGKLARILDSESRFGAELDSLADLISFGVAPSFLLYFWRLGSIKFFGWGLTMAFVLCMAIRLAKFNSLLQDNQNCQKIFFGVPAPMGGILSLLPAILSFGEFPALDELTTNQYFLCGYSALICLLVVSKIPTFSLKNTRIPKSLDSFVMLFLVACVVCLLIKPWITVPVLSLLYVASIPFSVYIYSRTESKRQTDK